jgi:hypothetical protein
MLPHPEAHVYEIMSLTCHNNAESHIYQILAFCILIKHLPQTELQLSSQPAPVNRHHNCLYAMASTAPAKYRDRSWARLPRARFLLFISLPGNNIEKVGFCDRQDPKSPGLLLQYLRPCVVCLGFLPCLAFFSPSGKAKDSVRKPQACHRCHRPAHLEEARIRSTVWGSKD